MFLGSFREKSRTRHNERYYEVISALYELSLKMELVSLHMMHPISLYLGKKTFHLLQMMKK
jgi:hypothetical protein